MRYAIVATTGWLLLVDIQSRKVTPLECDRPEYYGVSWFPSAPELVLSHSGLNNSDLVDIASYAQSERGWLSHGNVASREFLSAPHQILCAPDGRIICANTGRNVISVFDFARPNCFQEAGISSARWDRLALDQITGDHLNSVFVHGKHLYVIAHGFDRGSKLATFSYPDLELIQVEPQGERTGLHNIWITGEGQRISCHSENGSLIDLDAKSPLWESGAAMYTRGLAASGQYVLVGESQRTGRDLRRSSMSGLWLLDRQTWQAIDYLALGPYGAVNEVRILDVPDEAHHGHPFGGLEALISRDMLVELSRKRLHVAATQGRNRHVWGGFDFIFGAPEAQDDGAMKALADQLCLAVRHADSTGPLVFSYSIEAQAGAHVSAVIGYRGRGGDVNMAALLLQPAGLRASLSVWIHDGKTWSLLPAIGIHDLPQAGTIKLASAEREAVLSIDDKKVISLTAETLGVERCDQGLGIRWTGASVRPSKA